jgi:hypothetical protein
MIFNYGSPVLPFNGEIDEVSIYNRALTAAEIASIYAASVSGKCPLTPTPPIIVAQPTNETVFEGSTAVFSVTAGGTPPLTCQWQFNTTNINGATNASLTLTNVSFSQAGSYSVTVTNTFGATNSANAVLTVNPPPPCAPVPSGLISWWPAEGNANDVAGTNNGTLMNGASFGPGEVGQAFSFNGDDQYVQIADSPSLRPVSVTLECWFNANTNDGGNGVFISKPVGAGQSASYAMGMNNNGNLFGLVGNANGYESLVYTLDPVPGVWYHAAYTFDNTAQFQTLYVNGVVVASGSASMAIVYDTHSVGIGVDFNYGSPVLEFNGRIDETSIYNRALTAAEIDSIYAASTKGKCPIPPNIVVQPQDQSAVVGGSASFSVIAGGTPPLGYQWSDNGTNIANATNASLILTNVQITNDGTYTVIVSNVAGSVTSSNAVLTVGWPPGIEAQPASQSVESNCSAAFSVSACGTEPLSYQWWNNGLALGNQTNSSLAITNVQASNFGSYSVVVSNVFGATTSVVAVLALASPPVANPDSVLRFAEGGVRLNASDLMANDTVAIYDELTVIAVSSNSAAGGNVSLNGPWIYYAPPAGGAASDTFTYTVSDGHCGTATGTVTVQVQPDNPQPLGFAISRMGDGSLQLTFDGIPGQIYHIDYADCLSPPDWQMLTNQTADGFGVVQITDRPVTNAPARFYRAVWP